MPESKPSFSIEGFPYNANDYLHLKIGRVQNITLLLLLSFCLFVSLSFCLIAFLPSCFFGIFILFFFCNAGLLADWIGEKRQEFGERVRFIDS